MQHLYCWNLKLNCTEVSIYALQSAAYCLFILGYFCTCFLYVQFSLQFHCLIIYFCKPSGLKNDNKTDKTADHYASARKVHLVSLSPWPLTLWPPNLISSSLSHCTKVVNLPQFAQHIMLINFQYRYDHECTLTDSLKTDCLLRLITGRGVKSRCISPQKVKIMASIINCNSQLQCHSGL